MKLRRFIYIAAIILITFEINKNITYSFEVKKKAIAPYSIQIGVGPGSYSLPSTTGKYGEVLWVNENRELIWKDLAPKPELAFSDPFLITAEECNSKTGNNKFLPLNPYYKPTRGYCIATLDGTWEGVLKYKDTYGTHNDGIAARDIGRYCDFYYDQAYSLPPQFITQLWDAITSRLPKDRYWNKFKPEEQNTILDFIETVKGKKIYVNLNNFYSEEDLDLTVIIIGGFRLTDANMTRVPNEDKLDPLYDWDNEIDPKVPHPYAQNDTNLSHPYVRNFYYYGDFWDGRYPLPSLILADIKPFCYKPPNALPVEQCRGHRSVHVMCVR